MHQGKMKGTFKHLNCLDPNPGCVKRRYYCSGHVQFKRAIVAFHCVHVVLQ